MANVNQGLYRQSKEEEHETMNTR